MAWQQMAEVSIAVAEFAATWLLQSTLLLAVGLSAGWWLRRWGAATQSIVYRTTLAAVLLCPLAAWGLTAAGIDGLTIRLPQTEREPSREDPVPAPMEVAEAAELEPVPAEPMDGSHGPQSLDPMFDPSEPAMGVEPQWNRTDHTETVAASPTSSATLEPPAIGESTAASPASSESTQGDASHAGLIGITTIITAAAWGWLLISCVLLLRLVAAQGRLWRLRRGAVSAEPEELALCREVARRFRVAPPELLRTPFLSGPCLVGLRRPAVLLPEGDETPLLETLVHELAHLARRDCLWNLLRRLATAVLPMQPLLWWLSRRIEQSAEEVCDDHVVQSGADRRRYAGHLLDIASRELPATVPTGVGMVSFRSLTARRIARVLDASRTLSTRVGWRTMVATLLVGMAGTLLTGLLVIGHAAPAAQADAQPAEKAEEAATAEPSPPQPTESTGSTEETADKNGTADEKKTPRTVTGRVVDADGKPVAGATVTAARFRRGGLGYYGWGKDRDELARATTGKDGRFEITVPAWNEDPTQDASQDASSSDRWRQWRIVASADGHGPAWIRADDAVPAGEISLRLARDDVPITGRIVNLEGQPVPGVTVRVIALQGTEGGEAIDRWREAVDQPRPEESLLEASMRMVRGQSRNRSPRFPGDGASLPPSSPHLPQPVLTGADGRFRIEGLGRDRLARLDVRGPTAAFQEVQVVTRAMDRFVDRSQDAQDEPSFRDTSYYGADCTLVAAPAQLIEGVVRDADTGAPIPGAVVTVDQFAGSLLSVDGLLNATTDEQGRYRLIGVLKSPNNEGHDLAVYPPLSQPYFVTEDLRVPPRRGLDPIEFNIELKRGTWITGRVTDMATGAPVQAKIHYYPFLSNKYAQDYPRVFRPGSISANWTGDRHRTDAKGNFRVLGLPGRGIVAALSFDPGYRLAVGADEIAGANERGFFPAYNSVRAKNFHVLREVNIPEDAQRPRVNLQLDPGVVLFVRLVDPQGRELTGVRAAGQYPQRWGSPELEEEPLETGRVALRAFHRDNPRTVVFLHEKRKLGAILTPDDLKDDSNEITLTLRPCATLTGRLVDADGKPAVGAIDIGLPPSEGHHGEEIELAAIPTDAEGRFRYDLLPPGGPFYLAAQDRLYHSLPAEPRRFEAFLLTKDLTAESGQTVSVGTFNVQTGKPVAEKEPEPAPKPKTSLRGQVLGPDGKPVGGAKVMVWQDTDQNRATTDAAGEFAIDLTPSTAAKDQLIVTAVADGFGMSFLKVKPGEARPGTAGLTLKLPPAVPITGRIVNLEGRPVAGVSVKIGGVVLPEGNLDPWLAAVRRGEPPWIAHRKLGESNPHRPDFPQETKTDADGRFRIEGVGAERLVNVSIHGGGAAYESFQVVTRAIEPITWQFGETFFTETQRVYGAEFTHAAEPSRPIRGVVRDAETKQPLAGVGVNSYRFANKAIGGIQSLKTTSDDKGRFELDGMPKGEGNVLMIRPHDEQPYFMQEIEVPDRPGLEPIELTIELHRGLWITGRVTDKATGQPVAGARLHYMPFLHNTYAQALPKIFDEHGNVDGDQTRYVTDEDGRYRMPGLPGPAVVGVGNSNVVKDYRRGFGYQEIAAEYGKDERNGYLKTWHNPVFASPKWPLSMKAIDPAEDAEQVELNLQLDPGLSVPVRLVDPDGEPIAGVMVRGRTAFGYESDLFGPQLKVINLSPDETRTVMFRHDKRGLGKVVRVSPKGAEEEPLIVRLEPLATITGRLIDPDSQPVPTATIRPDLMPGGDFSLNLGSVITDAEGRFRVENVPVGCRYSLLAMPPQKVGEWITSKEVTVQPGQTTDAGDLKPEDE